MSFFSKIFGKSSTVHSVESAPQIERSLFIDDSEPTPFEVESEPTQLEKLQKKDFFHEGYVSGYEEHSSDILEHRTESIISEFQQAIRTEIDALEASMQEISVFLTEDYKKLMPAQFLKLRAKYDSFTLKKIEFNAEIELAADRKGICQHALNRFKEGFVKGLKSWTDETHFKA